jgi:uncharacterized membrane protein
VSAAWPAAGRSLYAGAAIALGIVGLRWGNFATVWQPVLANTPHRIALAYVSALALVLGGASILHRRTRRQGAVLLGVFYLSFAMLWLPRVARFPQLAGTWLGFLEQFSLVVGAIVVWVLAEHHLTEEALSTVHAISLCRSILGVCALSFGVSHFAAIPQTAAMVPRWLPPSQSFWAVVTGICHLLAGGALLTGVRALLAARLLTVMLLGFGALVWAPMLAADPGAHMAWAGNAVNLAIAGAAWVVADALSLTATGRRAVVGRRGWGHPHPSTYSTGGSRPAR